MTDAYWSGPRTMTSCGTPAERSAGREAKRRRAAGQTGDAMREARKRQERKQIPHTAELRPVRNDNVGGARAQSELDAALLMSVKPRATVDSCCPEKLRRNSIGMTMRVERAKNKAAHQRSERSERFGSQQACPRAPVRPRRQEHRWIARQATSNSLDQTRWSPRRGAFSRIVCENALILLVQRDEQKENLLDSRSRTRNPDHAGTR